MGAEALLRWRHPKKGVISPMKFIPVAEDTGLIHAITSLAFSQALEQQLLWRESGLEVKIALNLSPKTLLRSVFHEEVLQLSRALDTDLSGIEIEITESAVMDNVDAAIEALSVWRSLGVTVAIDDFGTGYSSLSYLKRLPVDCIKIDKSFVMDMLDDPADRSIVKAIIDLSHNFDRKVVAEGVETLDTAIELKSMNCDVLQGYFLSPPLSGVDFAEWAISKEYIFK